ncbi:energy transducer TonB [Pseudaeromonas pectinilytica]
MSRTDIADTADRIRIEEQMMNGFAMTRLGSEGAIEGKILAPHARISTADAVAPGVGRAEPTRQAGGMPPLWRAQLVCGVLVVLLHLLVAVAILHSSSEPLTRPKTEVVAVRWMAAPTPQPAVPVPSVSPPPEVVPPPKEVPVVKPKPVAKPKPVIKPKPRAVTRPQTVRPVPAVVEPTPAPPVVAKAKPSPAAPPPIQEAQYQSASLRNPAPSYPPLSQRFGEEGKVLLRVLVSPAGEALAVELLTSSGYPRLDAAARKMVAKWRFIPAKQGQETLQTWLRVPVVFQLRR